MTARSREHGAGLPSDQGGRPVPPGSGPPGSGPSAGGAAHRPRSHRKPQPARRTVLSRRQRMAVALVTAVGVVTAGFVTGFDSQDPAESTVQAFLLDWQQGNYQQAAALTTGSRETVAAQLAAAYGDLNATASFLSLGPITEHGATAEADFRATVDLDQGRHQWTYNGHFGLVTRHGKWFVNWSPSVINPSLGPGDRLAVVTSYPPRAQITDRSGRPLLAKSVDYQVGVYPGRLSGLRRTVRSFSGVAGLDSQQVLGEVRAAPPGDFLSLLTLDRADFRALWPRLSRVPGVIFHKKSERLFAGGAADATGDVGTENSAFLRSEGVAYEPGNTAGLSGLEQAYQDELLGTPTTSVVVVGPGGRDGATLWTSQGHAGTPLETTIDGRDQAAAMRVLRGLGGSGGGAGPGGESAGSAGSGGRDSGEIVAVDSATGNVLALATHAGSVPLPPGGPLNARIAPGMAFSIVSAAAMLGAGVQPDTPLPCYNSEAVGGQTFTYTGRAPSATFASDFARGCGTAIASMSTKLTPAQLAAAEKSFGVGADWDLRLRAFSGSARSASAGASLAAQAIGNSGVLMSPLGMALVAAEVDAGTGRTPTLVAPASGSGSGSGLGSAAVAGSGSASAADPAAQWRAPLSGMRLGELRGLMRGAVRSGSARAANLPGKPVYGQAGMVRTGKDAWLSWFVGYRGGVAVTVLQAGTTPRQAATSLAGAFLASVG